MGKSETERKSRDESEDPLRGIMATLFAVGQRRDPDGLPGLASRILAFLVAMYVFYVATFAILDPLELAAIFLCLMLSVLFLIVGAQRELSGSHVPVYDIILSICALASGLYFFVNAEVIVTRISLLDPLSTTDIVIAATLCVLTIEATRRAVGLGLTLIVVSMLAYNLWGDRLTGMMAHGSISYEHFFDQIIFTTNGLFGAPVRVAATYAFLFVTFGTFLEKCGGSEFFFNIAAIVSGRSAGGPAKVAVISSALYGTVSGSPTSDVVTTGSVTIPMMRRLGYPRSLAGAIEVAASTSGGLIPPIMASAAFIMVEVTGIPYLEIAKAAIIPAFLYLLGVFVQVDLLSRKLGLTAMDASEIPSFRDTFRKGGLYTVPIILLIATLFMGYSISFVAIVGTVSVFLVSLTRKSTRLGLFSTAKVFVTATTRMVPVTAACAAAGLVVGGISMTGLSGKLALAVFEIAGDGFLLSLVLTAAIAILLGMGMPTPSAYIMSAVLVAPVLVGLGLSLMAAHFFLLFFAVLSAITPPVAVAAYAASSLAEANPIRIAGRAVALAAPGFFIPFFFAFRPELLGQGGLWEIVVAVATACVGVVAIAICVAGYLRVKLSGLQRTMGLAGAIFLIFPDVESNLIGLALLAAAFISLLWLNRSGKT